MTATPAEGPGVPGGDQATLRLSRLLKRSVTDRGGGSLGRLADVIVRLRGSDYPLVTGLVAAVGGREIFVPIDQVSSFDGDPLRLSSARLSLRHFERRDGEVLLRADVLGHRLIDVPNARLVRAADLELARDRADWVLTGVDTRAAPAVRPARPGGSGQPGRRPGWLPGLARLRVAHRAPGQRAAARPVRPHPQARAGPDRRPAGERVGGGGIRDPRPGARRPRTRGGRLRGARRGPGHPAARRPHRRGDRRRAGPDARRRRRRRDRRAAAAAQAAGPRPAAARPEEEGADPDGLPQRQRRRPDGDGLSCFARPDQGGRRAGRGCASPRCSSPRR